MASWYADGAGPERDMLRGRGGAGCGRGSYAEGGRDIAAGIPKVNRGVRERSDRSGDIDAGTFVRTAPSFEIDAGTLVIGDSARERARGTFVIDDPDPDGERRLFSKRRFGLLQERR